MFGFDKGYVISRIVIALNNQHKGWLKKELNRKAGKVTRKQEMEAAGYVNPDLNDYIYYYSIPKSKLPIICQLNYSYDNKLERAFVEPDYPERITEDDIADYEVWFTGIRIKFAHSFNGLIRTKSRLISKGEVCSKFAPGSYGNRPSFVETKHTPRIHTCVFLEEGALTPWTVCVGYNTRKEAEELAAYLFGVRKLKDPVWINPTTDDVSLSPPTNVYGWRKLLAQRDELPLCEGFEIRRGHRTDMPWEVKVWKMDTNTLKELLKKEGIDLSILGKKPQQPEPVMQSDETKHNPTWPPDTVEGWQRHIDAAWRGNPNHTPESFRTHVIRMGWSNHLRNLGFVLSEDCRKVDIAF